MIFQDYIHIINVTVRESWIIMKETERPCYLPGLRYLAYLIGHVWINPHMHLYGTAFHIHIKLLLTFISKGWMDEPRELPTYLRLLQPFPKTIHASNQRA